MKKSATKEPIIFYVAIIVFALIIFSFHFTSQTYARYTTSASASSSARVAAYVFELVNEAQTESIPVTYTANGDGIYKIAIKNSNGIRTCEVAQAYTVTVQNLTNNVNYTFTLYSDENCTNIISEPTTGTLPAGVEETDYIYLKISLPQNADHSLANEIDLINISVSAQQID